MRKQLKKLNFTLSNEHREAIPRPARVPNKKIGLCFPAAGSFQ